MSKQLKKITKNVLVVCQCCGNITKCKKLVGFGCIYAGGNIVPELKEK